MKQEEFELMRNNLLKAAGLEGVFDGVKVDVEQLPPPPPEPEREVIEPPKEPEIPKKYQYVTVDGERPPEPISFFHTKKFIGIGAAFAIISGLLAYLLFFA